MANGCDKLEGVKKKLMSKWNVIGEYKDGGVEHAMEL